MAFDFNKQPARLFGIWPQTPFPVEVSIYGLCRMSCFYCFSNLNRLASDREVNLTNPTESLIRYLDKQVADELSPIGYFLREKYPVCFSNTTDPFQRDETTYRASEAFMGWANAHDVPLFIQTKGNVLYDEFERYRKLIRPGKDVAYISITALDDAVRRKTEPGAMSIEKRWELVRMLTDHGIPVVAACNPYLKEWVPDAHEYCRLAKENGARGVWWETLHLSQTQLVQIPDFYKGYKPKSNLLPMFAVNQLKPWYVATEANGLDFFPSPRWDAYHGHKAQWAECCDPQWVGNQVFDYAFELMRVISEIGMENKSGLTMFSWSDVRGMLEQFGMPNPVLNTVQFWNPFNNKVKADWNAWKEILGERANLMEILRYFFNRPWECLNFVWYHPLIQALWDDEHDLYSLDDNGDLIAVFNPKIKRGGAFECPESRVDWGKVVWLEGAEQLQEA